MADFAVVHWDRVAASLTTSPRWVTKAIPSGTKRLATHWVWLLKIWG